MHPTGLTGWPPRDVGSITADDQVLALPSAVVSDTAPVLAVVSVGWWIAGGLVIAWVGSGLLIAAVLGRRGHDLRSVGVLGAVLGPFLLGIARSNLVPREATAEPVEVAPGAHLGGTKVAVIAVLGPPADVVDAGPIVRALGSELGQVVMIRPLPFELVEDQVWDEAKQAAATVLIEAAAILADLHPRLLLVPGRADRAIRGLLGRDDVDLAVAVGGSNDLASICLDVGPESRAIVVAAPKQQSASASPRR